MQRRRGVSFGVQFGASVTFVRSRHAPRAVVSPVKRPAPWSGIKALPASLSRSLYTQRSVSRIQKRPQPVRIHPARPGQTKPVRVESRATSAPRIKMQSHGSPPTKASRGGWCFGRCVSALLVHVNMLLAAYAGAVLSTVARLLWDPLTYIALREAVPVEYELISYALLLAGCALLLLTYVALAALFMARWRRRTLLLSYCVVMLALAAAGAGGLRWAEVELRPHIDQGRAHLQMFIASTRQVLNLIAVFHDFTPNFQPFFETLEEDSTSKLKMVVMGLAGLAALQILGAMLALLLAVMTPPRSDVDDVD